MEDGNTEKYHPSSMIQDFVFSSWKSSCIRCISCRYIIIFQMGLNCCKIRLGTVELASLEYLVKSSQMGELL